MERILTFTLISIALVVSIWMLIGPIKYLDYAMSGRVARWYYRVFFNITPENWKTARRIRWTRIQGSMGTLASALAFYAWFAAG